MITCAKRIKFSPNVLKSDIWDKAREFYPFFHANNHFRDIFVLQPHHNGFIRILPEALII